VPKVLSPKPPAPSKDKRKVIADSDDENSQSAKAVVEPPAADADTFGNF